MDFTGRWEHKMRFAMRVWPRGALAIRLSLAGEKWSVDGMTFNANEKLEVVHRLGEKGFAGFELSEEDAEKLIAAGASGAKLGDMWLHCPGTTDSKAKKECYLEVNVSVYPEAIASRSKYDGGFLTVTCTEGEIENEIRRMWADSERKQLNRMRKSYGKGKIARWMENRREDEWHGYTLYDNPKILDLDVVVADMLAGKVALFDSRAFTGKMVAHIRKRLEYYVVPGRAPDEEGGLFRGYQFAGRMFLYFRRIAEEKREAHTKARLERMHESVRERGRSSRRTVFVRCVIERVAKKYGVSRQRVTTRFIEEGIIDYLIRSAESVPYVRHREAKAHFTGKITEAVQIVSFIIDGLAAMEGGDGI